MIDTAIKARRRREADELERTWATDPRWRGIERTYSGEDVVRLRGSIRVEHTLARLGAEGCRMLERETLNGSPLASAVALEALECARTSRFEMVAAS